MLIKTIDFQKEIMQLYPHQNEFAKNFFSNEYRFFMNLWHRRAGKDAVAFPCVWLFAACVPGNYLYLLPKIGQARNVVWEGKDLNGRRWVDSIPQTFHSRPPNNSECKIYLANGSIIHVTGADNLMNAHLGSNLKGVVFSEYQRTNPHIFNYVRPILNRSDGWAIFTYTAYGKGHAHKLFQSNKDRSDSGWLCSRLTVDDTQDNEGLPIFSKEQIEEERKSGMDEALIQQEYYCDESAPMSGAFFAESLKKAREDGRIHRKIDVRPNMPVHTSWDLGYTDANSIWFFQFYNDQFWYFKQVDEFQRSIPYYKELLDRIQKQYGFERYGHHFMPHDVANADYGTGKSRRVQFMEHGIEPHYVPMLRVVERVQAARSMFHKVNICETGCELGLDGLATTRADWDEVKRVQKSPELHDWSSHIAAAFEYGLVGWLDGYNKEQLWQVKEYARRRA